MNNLEKIKKFSMNEMVEFLLTVDHDGVNYIYCNRVCKYHGNCDKDDTYSCEHIKQRECIKAILESNCSLKI